MKKWIVYSGFVILFILITYLLWQQNNLPKVRVIRADYILENFIGAKEASEVLLSRNKEMSKELDSLDKVFQQVASDTTLSRNEMEGSFNRLKNEVKLIRENNIRQQQQLDLSLSQGVVLEINDALQLFGKEKEYDVMFAGTEGLGVVYSVEKFDVTEEFLEYLNQRYETGE